MLRLDVRSSLTHPDLSRTHYTQRRRGINRSDLPDGVWRRVEEIVTQHLTECPTAQGYEGWRYRNQLAKEFPIQSFWSKRADMIPITEHGVPSLASSEALSRSNLTLIVPTFERSHLLNLHDRTAYPYPEPKALASIPVTLNYADFRRIADYLSDDEIFELRQVVRFGSVNERFLAVEWSGITAGEREPSGLRKVHACDFEAATIVALFIEGRPTGGILLVNKRNKLGEWYLRVRDALATRRVPFEQRTVEALDDLMEKTTRYTISYLDSFQQHLRGWSSISGLEEDLKPPPLSLSDEMFGSVASLAV